MKIKEITGLTIEEMEDLKKESIEYGKSVLKQKEQKLMQEADKQLLMLGYIPMGLESRRNVRARRTEMFRKKWKWLSKNVLLVESIKNE